MGITAILLLWMGSCGKEQETRDKNQETRNKRQLFIYRFFSFNQELSNDNYQSPPNYKTSKPSG